MTKTRNIAIIPARGGSKRLPGKNILSLGGMPLLAHSIVYAKANPHIIDEVYVSTDDDSIKKIALEFGAKVIDRPSAISGDYEPTYTAVQHAISTLNFEVENVILLQPTNPLRPENLLRDCFEEFERSNANSLFTVSQNHHKLGKIHNNQFVPFNYKIGQRSQDIEPLYFENGLLYISKINVINNNTILSEDAIPYVVNHVFATVDIDDQDDFDYADYLLNK